MATGAELAILLKLRDEATAAMKKAQGSLDALEGSAKKGQGAFSALSNAMSRAEDSSKKLAVGVGLAAVAVAGIGLKGLQVAGEMEQVRVAFNTMLGSAEAGGQMVKDLWQFAATTPFEFSGLVKNARLLKAMGFEAQAIIPTMTAVGEAVSALGGGEFEIQRVVRALGQMQAKGKVAAQEMTLQLSETGIPAWKYLAEAIGTTIPEAMKRVEAGTVDAATGIKAVLDGMARDFKGGMANQMNTLMGIWSNTKDQITGLLWAIGDTIMTTFDVKEKLKNFNSGLTSITSSFRDFADLVAARGLDRALDLTFSNDKKIVILAMAGAIVGALTPAFIALGAAIWGALAPLIPFMAVGAGLAGLGALVWQNWDKVPPIFDETNAGLAITYNEMNQVSESGAKLTDMQRDMIRALIDTNPKFKTLQDQLAGMNEEQLTSILSSAKLGIEIKKTAGATQQGIPPLEEYGKAAEIAMMKVRDLAETIKSAGRAINDMAVNISDLRGRLHDMENPLNIQLLTIDQLKQKVALWGDEMVISKNAANRLADEAAAALLSYNQKYAEMLALQESGAQLTQEQWQAIRDAVDDARDAASNAYSIAQRGAETYAKAQDRVNAGLDEWNRRAGEEAKAALEKQAAAIEAVRLRMEAWNEQLERNNNLMAQISGRQLGGLGEQRATQTQMITDAGKQLLAVLRETGLTGEELRNKMEGYGFAQEAVNEIMGITSEKAQGMIDWVKSLNLGLDEEKRLLESMLPAYYGLTAAQEELARAQEELNQTVRDYQFELQKAADLQRTVYGPAAAATEMGQAQFAYASIMGAINRGMSPQEAVAQFRKDQPLLGKTVDIITTGPGLETYPGFTGPRPRVPGFQLGGIMPGPPSQARLAAVHGQEAIIPGDKLDAMISLLSALVDKDASIQIDGNEMARAVSTRQQSRSSSLSRMGA